MDTPCCIGINLLYLNVITFLPKESQRNENKTFYEIQDTYEMNQMRIHILFPSNIVS
jgi:hypothetical protein